MTVGDFPVDCRLQKGECKMYMIVRIVLGIALCALPVVLTDKLPKRRSIPLAIMVCTAFIISTANLPVENYFYTFSSPESCLTYYGDYADVEAIVQGGKSDLVIAREGEVDLLIALPKTDGGWQIGLGRDTQLVSQTVSENAVIYLYRYRPTEEYFLSIVDVQGAGLQISDPRQSDFYRVGERGYYGYVPGFAMPYQVEINGETVVIHD